MYSSTESDQLQERALTASGLRTGYLDWPGLARVFQLRRTIQLKGGGHREDLAYGLTSLPPGCADAATSPCARTTARRAKASSPTS